MTKLVISLGGSFVSPQSAQDQTQTAAMLDKYIAWLKHLSHNHLVAVIVGGGHRARAAIAAAKKNNPAITNHDLDEIGIQATRYNADWLREQCGVSSPLITDPNIELPAQPGLWFGGGWIPGRSTDHSAVRLAISNGVSLVTNISNISYLYNKDPKKFSDAHILTTATWDELKTIVGDTWEPGLNVPFDPMATQIAAEHHLTVNIVNGWDWESVQNAVTGKPFQGTVIHS